MLLILSDITPSGVLITNLLLVGSPTINLLLFFHCIAFIFILFVCFIFCTDLPCNMSHSIDFIKLQKGLKIVHINVRSILKHCEEVESLFLDGIFDVVVLTETWLHANVGGNLISSEHYNVTRLYR